MSGNHSIRGYLVQTLISVLDSLDDQNSWASITLEPVNESEKVDILWEYEDLRTKVSQVKSTINIFKYSAVDTWCQELESGSPDASEYELILVGHCQAKVLKNEKIRNVSIPTPKALNIESLLEEASNKLDHYYELKGRPKINASLRRILIGNLVSHLEFSSITGELLTRSEFDTKLLDWIQQIENQVALNPLMALTPVNESQDSLEIEHRITRKILSLINWAGLSENLKTQVVDEDSGEESECLTNFSGTWQSKIKDETRDFAIIHARLDDNYNLDSGELRQELFKFNSVFRSSFLPDIKSKYEVNKTDTYGILFWYSSDINEHQASLRLLDYVKDKFLDDKMIYTIIDNSQINFLVSSIVAANNHSSGLRLKFLYPQTEANVSLKNVGQHDLKMPPQFLNSSIIPIVKEDRSKISILLFCKDPYDPEHLKKLVWLIIKLTNSFGNEYIIYFPDFHSNYNNEASEIISQFENDEVSQKLRVEKFESLSADILSKYPLPENLRNATYELNSSDSSEPVRINEVFLNQLPYGDVLKPLLTTQAVTAKDLKLFLEKKGIFAKHADRKRLINIMCAMLFSPKEIADFKAMIDVKERPLKSVPEFRKLSNPTSIEEVVKEFPRLVRSEVLENMDVSIAGDLEFKANPERKDEYILDLTTAIKDLSSQLSLNTTWGRVLISMSVDNNDLLLINNIKTSTKNDKLIANRIVKRINQKLEDSSVIEPNRVKVWFAQFQNNVERVNFLLSFTDISSSTMFKTQDIERIKFKYDENLDVPDELRDKTEHELVTYLSGKRLAGLAELSEDTIKRILLLDEVQVLYEFDALNVKDLKYKVSYNFSNAIFNKKTFDGEFASECWLIKNHKTKKISNLAKLERDLSNEVEKLKLEKLKKFNLI